MNLRPFMIVLCLGFTLQLLGQDLKVESNKSSEELIDSLYQRPDTLWLKDYSGQDSLRKSYQNVSKKRKKLLKKRKRVEEARVKAGNNLNMLKKQGVGIQKQKDGYIPVNKQQLLDSLREATSSFLIKNDTADLESLQGKKGTINRFTAKKDSVFDVNRKKSKRVKSVKNKGKHLNDDYGQISKELTDSISTWEAYKSSGENFNSYKKQLYTDSLNKIKNKAEALYSPKRLAQKRIEEQQALLDSINGNISTYKKGDFLPAAHNMAHAEIVGHVEKKFLDSLSSLANKDNKLVSKYKSHRGKVDEYKMKAKRSFWERSFFDGVLDLSQASDGIVSLTPAMGYNYSDKAAVGGGLVLEGRFKSKVEVELLGVRAFHKYNVIKEVTYLHFEYQRIFGDSDINDDEVPDTNVQKNNWYVGLGHRIMVRGIGLDAQLLYGINHHEAFSAENIRIRLGIVF